MAPGSYGQETVASSQRPERPKSAPLAPPPASGRGVPPPPVPRSTPTLVATPPVGVREGDVLIIGVDVDMTNEELDHMIGALRDVLGVRVEAVCIPGHVGVTVLRPER